MARRIAIVMDVDQWPASSAHHLVTRAMESGRVVYQGAFGALDASNLESWRAHLTSEGFELNEHRGTNVADDAMVEMADVLLSNDEADVIWLATKDRRLIERMAEVVGERARLRILRERVELPPNATWVDLDMDAPRRPPVGARTRSLLRSAVLANERDGSADFSRVASELTDLSYRDLGRSSLLELFEDLPDEFEVIRRAGGGPVRIGLVDDRDRSR